MNCYSIKIERAQLTVALWFLRTRENKGNGSSFCQSPLETVT